MSRAALLLAPLAALALAAPAPAAGPGEPEGCGVCHGRERVSHERSIHRSADVGCVSCHGGDPARVDEKEAAHSKERGFLGKLTRARSVETCGSCHSDVARMRPYGLRADVLAAYRTSHHGKAVLEKGDEHAAACVDCHGAHDVLRVLDPRSPAYRGRVPATCGKCHADTAFMKEHGLAATAPADFGRSVHGLRLAQGDPAVPSCAGCHDAHAAAPPATGEVAAVCGTCHRDALERFRESPHYGASRRGEMKQCVTCHGNHAVDAPDFDLFDRPAPPGAPHGAGSRCIECHDPKDPADRGGVVAAAFGEGFRAATKAIRDATVMVDGVASGGYFVDDERESLEQARRELVSAVPLSHSMDLQRVEAALRRTHAFVNEARERTDMKLRESRDRRILGSFTAFVLLGVAGFLALRRRRIASGNI